MTKKKRMTREIISEGALDFIRKRGVERLNARSLATSLHCSTQPLFYLFKNMKEIKQVAYELAYKVYGSYVSIAFNNEKPFLAAGLGYIAFAKAEPKLFEFVFLLQKDGKPDDYDIYTPKLVSIIQDGTGLDENGANIIYLSSWIFAHGFATMEARGTINIKEEDVRNLLSLHYHGILAELKQKSKN